MDVERQDRFAFPMFDPTTAVRQLILLLMLDGKRRSVLEIQEALGTRKEISARIREMRKDGWAFNDSRSEGPDDDGVFRYQLNLQRSADVTAAQR